jgi:hypothetical protein
MVTETFAKEPVQKYIESLAESFPDCHILLSGYQVVAQEVFPPENVSILKSLSQTLEFLSVASAM